MRPYTLITALAAATALAGTITSAASAKGGAVFTASDFSSCNGTTINGTSDPLTALTIGQTTRRQAKALYRKGAGDAVKWDYPVSTPKGSGYGVDLIFYGGDDDSVLTGVYYRYTKMDLTQISLENQIGAGTLGYPRGREENWYFESWPQRGTVAFLLDGKVAAIFTMSPAAFRPGNLPTTPTNLADVSQDQPQPSAPAVAEIGTVTVDASRLSGIALDDGLKSSIVSRVKDTGSLANGTLRYSEGASGTYTVSVSGDYVKGNGGQLTVTCGIEGVLPNGTKVYGNGSADFHLYYSSTTSNPFGDIQFDMCLTKAEQAAEGDFASNMAAPPAPDESALGKRRLRDRNLHWNAYLTVFQRMSYNTGPRDTKLLGFLSEGWEVPLIL